MSAVLQCLVLLRRVLHFVGPLAKQPLAGFRRTVFREVVFDQAVGSCRSFEVLEEAVGLDLMMEVVEAALVGIDDVVPVAVEIESGTVVFNLNPVVLAWLPTTLLALVTLALLARAR